MKIIMFFIFFLLVGAFFIISNEDIKMDSKENISKFFDLYGHWIDRLAGNSKNMLGFVIKMEWLPGEEAPTEI